MDWTPKLLICCVVYAGVITGVVLSSSPTVVNGPVNGYITAAEDFTVGNELVQFQVQDSDPFDVISVRPNSVQTAEYVSLNLTGPGNDRTVHVQTIKELDRDHGVTSVSLKFVINDIQLNQIYYTIDLYITDVNDNAPMFQNEPYSWRIPENSAANIATYSQIYATDLDVGSNGQVSYRMEPDAQSSSTDQEYAATFQIDPFSGVVQLVKELDYETNNFYQFTVVATDGGGLSSNTTFIIRVLDVQDTPPFFTGIHYRSTIDENVQVGHSVITLTARDGDTGVSNDIDYSIITGPCSSLFAIDSTGEIKTAGDIDRDTGVVYNESGVCVLQVQASEMNTSGEDQYGNTTCTTDVTVIINDANDNVPRFLQTNYTAEILENMPENGPITIVGSSELSVRDYDQEGNGFATMHITVHNPNGTYSPDFTASPSIVSGSSVIMIRVSNSHVLDYEQRHHLTLWVVATEKANSNQAATATVVLSIEDMNDNSPQFDNTGTSEFHIYENAPNGTTVGNITASDADSSRYSNVTYHLAGGNAAKFHVDPSTGEITTVCATNCSREFDREMTSVYYLTYIATDAGGRSNSKAIVIHLDDVNDNTPRFSRDIYTAFLEGDNNNVTNPLLTVTAIDYDAAANSEVIYTIAHVSDPAMNDTFVIDDTTGELFLKEPIDYQNLNHAMCGQLYVIVEAKDKGYVPLSSSARVDITVKDMNTLKCNQPTFTTPVYETVTPTTTDARSAFSVDMPHSIVSGTLTFSRVNYIYGSDYNPSTGIFTCSKPGAYQFSMGLTKTVTVSRVDYIHCKMFKSSMYIMDLHLDPTDDDTDKGQASISYSILLQMKRGDTVSLQNCSPVNILDDTSYFMGYLLYAEP